MSQFQILGRRPFPFKAIPIRFAYTNFPDTIKEGLPFVEREPFNYCAAECAESGFASRTFLAALRPYERPSRAASEVMKLDMLR
jgi:hypothetical protein